MRSPVRMRVTQHHHSRSAASRVASRWFVSNRGNPLAYLAGWLRSSTTEEAITSTDRTGSTAGRRVVETLPVRILSAGLLRSVVSVLAG